MILFAGGRDRYYQLGMGPTILDDKGFGIVETATRVPFDLDDVCCISGGLVQAVIIKGGDTFVAGSDNEFRIGGDERRTYERFTHIKIYKEPISWAACGCWFTICLTITGKVILCHTNKKPERILISIAKNAICFCWRIL